MDFFIFLTMSKPTKTSINILTEYKERRGYIERAWYNKKCCNALYYRGFVIMGARGAMAPMNFQRVAFGTHEIWMSKHYGTLEILCVTMSWHPRSQIPNAPLTICK